MFIRSLVSEFWRNVEIFSFPDVLFTDRRESTRLEVIIDLHSAHTIDHVSYGVPGSV